MLDVFAFLTGSSVRSFCSASLRPATGSVLSSDNKAVILEYEDGSVAQLGYMAVAAPALAKERLEAHFDGKSLVLDDYRTLSGHGVKPRITKCPVQDKGHAAELEALWSALTQGGHDWPIPLDSMIETTSISLELA